MFPAMPPMVACAAVAGSTGKKRPCGLRNAFSRSSTTPGSTPTVPPPPVKVADRGEVLAGVDHQPVADGLPGLRGPGAAQHQRHALQLGDLHHALQVAGGPRKDHAHGLDLVDGRVGAVPAAAEGIEKDLALDLASEPGRDAGSFALRRAVQWCAGADHHRRVCCHRGPHLGRRAMTDV